MAIIQLPPVTIESHHPPGAGGPDHPLRIATHRAAGLDADGWTEELRDDVARYFDERAGEWHTRTSAQRSMIVADALARGLGAVKPPTGPAVEVGSGIGTYSPLVARYFSPVIAVDLSLEMLKLAPDAPAHRVLADGSKLPLRDASAAAVVLINCFLFPDEVVRVLKPGGVVVWVNSSGESTPIHLTTEQLASRLPSTWSGVTSRAGDGLWCVLQRSAT